MHRRLTSYVSAVVFVWLVLAGIAVYRFETHLNSIWIVSAALPAFLLETLFYIGSVLENARDRFAAATPGKTARATLLWASAILPYLALSLPAGTFQTSPFLLLVLLTGVLSFWHVVMPRRIAFDLVFLGIAAVPFIARSFQNIYRSPAPEHFRVDVLGHLMWVRLGLMALLVLRDWKPGPVSLWPQGREWRIGATWFLIGIVPLGLEAVLIKDVQFVPHAGPWWLVIGLVVGYFFAFLWVVAFGEELFFRGVIERMLLDSRKSPLVAIAVSAIVFGSAHLWFRAFPDWRRAVTVVLLGLICGAAYLQAGSIRASMVTHSLVIATWRTLFR